MASIVLVNFSNRFLLPVGVARDHDLPERFALLHAQILILQKLEDRLKCGHDLRLRMVFRKELFKSDAFARFHRLHDKMDLLLNGVFVAWDLADLVLCAGIFLFDEQLGEGADEPVQRDIVEGKDGARLADVFVRLLEEVADRLQFLELFGLLFDEAKFLERADELRLVLFDLHIELGVLFEVGNEALRLDLEDGRRNVEIVAHFVDVEVRKPPHIAEELFRDFGDKDILDLDLFLIDEK